MYRDKSQGPLIAVIDDDASVRIATDSLLRSREFAVCTFASAQDFFRSPLRGRAACIITDLRMPAMSGIELQESLRARGSTVPFIFITAFPEAAAHANAIGRGAKCFLTKPFEASALLKEVEAVLSTALHGT